MFNMYILKSKTTGKRYIGQTSDMDQRLIAHNNGESRYTKNRGPWVMIYRETVSTRKEALIREKFLKSGKGREFLESIGK